MDKNVCKYCGENIVVINSRDGTWTHKMSGIEGMSWYIRACQGDKNGIRTTNATPREEKLYTLDEARRQLALEECIDGHTDLQEIRRGGEWVASHLTCRDCGTRYVRVDDPE